MDNLYGRMDYWLKGSPRHGPVLHFHRQYKLRISDAKGSASKHQAWRGGYLNHVLMCMDLAELLYFEIECPFKLESVAIVLYFHDIEKVFKYSDGYPIGDKDYFLYTQLPRDFQIEFTDEERNAIKYIHGEGNDYCEERVMNELAGFCHAVDVLSARTFHNLKRLKYLPT